MQETSVRRGDIFYADLSPVVGSEQGGMRPGAHSPERHRQPPQPDGYRRRDNLPDGQGAPPDAHRALRRGALRRDSVVLCEQIRTIDKSRLRERMGALAPRDMLRVDDAIAVSFGLRHESPPRPWEAARPGARPGAIPQ